MTPFPPPLPYFMNASKISNRGRVVFTPSRGLFHSVFLPIILPKDPVWTILSFLSFLSLSLSLSLSPNYLLPQGISVSKYCCTCACRAVVFLRYYCGDDAWSILSPRRLFLLCCSANETECLLPLSIAAFFCFVFRMVARLWARLLKVEESTVTPSSDFFELGGHSLLLAKLSASLLKDTGVVVDIPSIIDRPTLEELAELLDSEMTQKAMTASTAVLVTAAQRYVGWSVVCLCVCVWGGDTMIGCCFETPENDVRER